MLQTKAPLSRLVLAAGAVMAISSAALAGINGDPLTITATTDTGRTASFVVDIDMGSWNQDYNTWNYNGPNQVISLADGLGEIAQLELQHFSVEFVYDPQVNLSVGVVAGAAATTFRVSSALLTFPSLANSTAQASAGLTVTDRNNNGASVTGLQSGGNVYGAWYNGTLAGTPTLPPNGTNYTNLVNAFVVGSGGTSTGNGSAGVDLIGTTFSMASQWAFTLSPRDSAQGTSTYIILPTPGSLALLGLGGLVAGRRRR